MEKSGSMNRQNQSPERSSTVFAVPATVRGTLAFGSGNRRSPDVLLDHWRPTVDEIFVYHIIFYRYPDISVALLPFFS